MLYSFLARVVTFAGVSYEADKKYIGLSTCVMVQTAMPYAVCCLGFLGKCISVGLGKS